MVHTLHHSECELLGQGLHRVRPSAELLLQPVLVRHPDQAVQEGLRHDLQGHRRVQSHQVTIETIIKPVL